MSMAKNCKIFYIVKVFTTKMMGESITEVSFFLPYYIHYSAEPVLLAETISPVNTEIPPI